jgi:predicted amidophosphoribosyltransferase
MSLNVANCPNCGSVYQKNFRNMCTSCSTKLDVDINSCIKFLWKNPKTTTEELSETTHIDMSLIIKFIKQGIFSKSFKNLTYPCESCKSHIRENRLCFTCTSSIKKIAQEIKGPTKIFEPASAFKISDRFNRR